MNFEQQYIDLYRQASMALKNSSATLLNNRRDKAFALFEQIGFPTRQQEDYLYSQIQKQLGIN